MSDIKYPQLLTSIAGMKIDSKEAWEMYRRSEIFTLFEEFEYGVRPIDKPDDLTFSVKTIERENEITQKKVDITFMGYTIKADIFVPKNNDKPLPAFMLLMHQFEIEQCDIDNELDFEIIPIKDIIKRGYAVVAMNSNSISPDVFEGEPFKEGIFTLFNEERKPNSWGIISAWAWGASRVMDYLEKDKDIDNTRVAVIGHSRSGKTALWTGANDQRFKLIISNDSGCSGAALLRGKQGEHIKEITTAFDWFCDRYTTYKDNEDMLPFDQHMLLALIAPRPLYVASSSEDAWADPEMEMLSAKMASEVYELYGLKGLTAPDKAEIDTAYQEGNIAYHVKTGEHSLTKFDWNSFMDFADKKM